MCAATCKQPRRVAAHLEADAQACDGHAASDGRPLGDAFDAACDGNASDDGTNNAALRRQVAPTAAGDAESGRRFCPFCGVRTGNHHSFCSNCGKSLV
ncbi:unnamed protein product [Polarella glacialis]|uniref:Zinc ribbon domain-containing protein n=1 Tax=Polarella glacialis TaxID=89957 RepID=A0A813FML2_POLGL|nr:unnamed protein product [Polarella glacialis]